MPSPPGGRIGTRPPICAGPYVYFGSGSEAGQLVENVYAYPTTYVVDRNGNIVGEPIVGAITEKKQAETLQKLIDQALAADMG